MTSATPTTTTKEHTCYQGFDLDISGIKKIWTIIKDNGHTPKVVFRCSDESTIDSLELSTLTDFANTDDRQICRIDFKCDDYARPQIALSFAKHDDYGADISYSLRGDDSDVLYISRAFNDIIRNCRVWYSPLVAMSPLHYGMRSAAVTVLGLALVVLVFVSLYLTTANTTALPSTSVRNIVVMVGTISNILLFVVSTIHFSKPLRRKLLPAANFAIGGGVKRSESSRNWRKLIGGIIGTILLGLATTAIYEHFFG